MPSARITSAIRKELQAQVKLVAQSMEPISDTQKELCGLLRAELVRDERQRLDKGRLAALKLKERRVSRAQKEQLLADLEVEKRIRAELQRLAEENVDKLIAKSAEAVLAAIPKGRTGRRYR